MTCDIDQHTKSCCNNFYSPGRACQKNDYYLWELSDLRNNSQHCSLGKKQKFERRLADTKCYNGYNYDRPVQVSNCLCTREDFTW